MLKKKKYETNLKNNASFISRISKISNTFIDNAEDFGIVMSICSLLEYSDNYSMTSGTLWNHYKDDKNENSDNNRINNSKAITRKSLEYKIKIIRRTLNDNKTLDAEVVVLLKYLRNF